MLATKIGHHPLQTSGAPARTHANSLTQQTHVPLPVRAPDPLLHADRTEDTPPRQSFFFTHIGRTVLCFQLLAQHSLGLGSPASHAGVAQTTHLFNEQPLDFIGTPDWAD